MFIPLRDDNSQRRRFPVFVWICVAVNCVVWYVQLSVGEPFMASYAAVPFELWHGVDVVGTHYLNVHGETVPIPNSSGPSPIYLTALSSMFMHASWMHIIGNMMYLIIFGDQIEDELGHQKFILFYLLAGLAATGAYVLSDSSSMIPCVGASGAIAGVLGAYLVLHPTNRVEVIVINRLVSLPAVVVLTVWGVLQVVGQAGAAASSQGGVAYMAHLGGLVFGLVVGLLRRCRVL